MAEDQSPETYERMAGVLIAGILVLFVIAVLSVTG